jgi:hypothetical protein
MDTNPDSATSDEVKKSIKDLELAVEQVISLHVTVEQVHAVVDATIEEMMKKDLVLAVERAMSVHLRPDEIRDVVSGAIQEYRERKSMELSSRYHVPSANVIIAQSALLPSYRGPTGSWKFIDQQGMKPQTHLESDLSDEPISRLYSALGNAIFEAEWTQWNCPPTGSTRATPSQRFGGYIQLSRTNIYIQRALKEGEAQGLREPW